MPEPANTYASHLSIDSDDDSDDSTLGSADSPVSLGGMDPKGLSLQPVSADVVLPVVSEVLGRAELDVIMVCWVEGPTGALVPRVDLVAVGEPFRLTLSAMGLTAADTDAARQHLRSSLQDFVAESSFGWGRQR